MAESPGVSQLLKSEIIRIANHPLLWEFDLEYAGVTAIVRESHDDETTDPN
jgi:hypothetical protein